MRKYTIIEKIRTDSGYQRLMQLVLVMFFIFLSDAILSDFVPGFLEKGLGNFALMGIVLAFSSVVGIATDLLFPQLLKSAGVRHLVKLTIFTAIGFVVSLFVSSFLAILPIYLLAMAFWGIYFEFLSFSNQLFVSENVEIEERPRAWSVVTTFKSLAYFLGPVIGGVLAFLGDRGLILTSGIFLLIGLLLLFIFGMGSGKYELEKSEVTLFKELDHFWLLIKDAWPVLVLSMTLGFLDALMWTVGTIINDKSAYGFFGIGLFLPLYMVAFMFSFLIMGKLGIYEGKKKWAYRLLLVIGLLLVPFNWLNDKVWVLLAIFMIGALMSVATPLTDATYSDLIKRMGKERKHLVGLSNSMSSFAYILGPLLAGFMASVFGEFGTYSVYGIVFVLVALFLLLFSPRKIRLSQSEIQSWE